jgi:hypothetical protein
MSGMTPDEFYEGFVWQDYVEWQAEPDSIRRAFHVAISAFHLADHYCRYYQRNNTAFAQKYQEKDDKGLQDFQEALRRRTPSFKIIQDMANAYKHLYTRASCSIASGGAIMTVKFDSETIEHEWSEKSYVGTIIIRHRDGSVSKFVEAIDQTMQMWSEIISQGDPLSV